MEFQLLDKEITESKLYYKAYKLSQFDGRDVADLLYLCTLGLIILAHEDMDFVRSYARRTSQFGTYALFRTHATDMYLLSYQILHPENDHVRMNNPVFSKDFLNNLKYDGKANLRFLKHFYDEIVDKNEVYTYMYRLERQLNIRNSRYRTWRREVFRWNKIDEKYKRNLFRLIMFEFKRLGNNGGIKSDIAQRLLEIKI